MANEVKNINKSALQEAKDNYDELREFAKKAALQEVEKEIDVKLKNVINENIEIDINTDSGEVNIKNTETDELIVEPEENEAEVEPIELDTTETDEDEEFEIIHTDDLDETIEITEDNMEENILEQEPVAQGMAPGAPASIEAPAEDVPAVEEEPIKEVPENLNDSEKIDMIFQRLMGDETEDVEVIEDMPIEEPVEEMPVDAPTEAAPVAEEPPAPLGEDEEIIFELGEEFDIEELQNDGKEEEFEIVDEVSLKNLDEEIEIIDGDDSKESETPVDEVKTHGVGYAVQRTVGTSAGPQKSVETRSRQTSSMPVNENKAQDESKKGELLKENESLTKQLNEMKNIITDYKSSFIGLRKQFDEMQTFNAKLAYLNKLFASGGFTTSEKEKLSENFDQAETAVDAQKLYNKIIKENDLKVGKSVIDVIKVPSTGKATIKSKSESLYESVEIKRMKELAGLKPLNEN